MKGALGRAYLGVRGYAAGCLAILGFEGAGAGRGTTGAAARIELVRALRRPARRALARAGVAGVALLGPLPARRPAHPRRDGRDARDGHAVVEPAGACTARVAGAIAEALARPGTPGLVMCHVSHVYETGASLYFTFLARQREEDPIGQWQTVKRAAGDAIVAGGGTITHHHAVGRDHAPWMGAEVGARRPARRCAR